MRIMIAITNLEVGGAQTFILRLVEDLAFHHEVYVYNFSLFLSDQDVSVVQRLPKSVHVISFNLNGWLLRGVNFLDFHCSRLGLNLNLLEKIRSLFFLKSVLSNKIDLVNTHLFHADYIVTKALARIQIPIVLVDHGDYRFVMEDGIANLRMISNIFRRVNAIIYISDSNLNVLKQFHLRSDLKLRKIYNGFRQPLLPSNQYSLRQQLSIHDDAIVFGMVARGIPEKGWTETVQAFQKVLTTTQKEIHLIFVGWSEYLQELKALVEHTSPNIHFVGYADRPEDWIQICDVCLLPTYFSGESLPCSVIEYLAQGKPVIATDVGGIPEMLQYDKAYAGTIVPMQFDQKADPEKVAQAMLSYVEQPDLIQVHSDLAILAFEKFRMELCSEAYQQLFEEVVNPNILSKTLLSGYHENPAHQSI